MRVFGFLITFALLNATQAIASSRIVSTLGGASNMCSGQGPLLQQYVRVSNEYRAARMTRGVTLDEAERYQEALEVLAEGMDPAQHGLTVLVEIDGPISGFFNYPQITLGGKVNFLASVSGPDVSLDFKIFNVVSSKAQIRIEFTLLGICGFANANDYSVGDAQVQAAVNSLLGI